MTLNEIRKYVVDHDKNSCLYLNYGDSEFEEEYQDLLLEELDTYFWCEYMDLCGCGIPEDCKLAIRDLLRILSDYTDGMDDVATKTRNRKLKERFNSEYLDDNPLLAFMVYILNKYDFLEHGCSVGGSWITKLGRMYLYVLEKLDLDN